MTVRVYIRHLRALRYCSRGSRTWFERHGLDWGGFLRDGVPAEALEATGDGMAIKAAQHARDEAQAGGEGDE